MHRCFGIKSVLRICCIVFISQACFGQSYIWLEQPSACNFNSLAAWDILSKGNAPAVMPGDDLSDTKQYVIKYSFEIRISRSKYTIWGRTFDRNWASPAKWRIDNGEWENFTPEAPVNSMTGTSYRMDWAKWATVELNKGKHTIELEVLGKRPQGDCRYFVIDAIFLTHDSYVPSGSMSPDAMIEKSCTAIAALVKNTPEEDNILKQLDKIAELCRTEGLGHLEDFQELSRRIENERENNDFFKMPLITPLHGNVTNAKIVNGKINITVQWDHELSGKLWIGFLKRGALYHAQMVNAEKNIINEISLAMPENLPAGRLEVVCVPVLKKCIRPAEGAVEIPEALASRRPFPAAWGIYRDSLGVLQPWHVTKTNMLIWNGEPYIPFGGMINSPNTWVTHVGQAADAQSSANELSIMNQRVELLKQNGLTDIYFNGFGPYSNPNEMNKLIILCERQSIKYGIEIGAMPYPEYMGFLRLPTSTQDIPAGKNTATITYKVASKELQKQHRCIWYILDDKKLTKIGIGIFKALSSTKGDNTEQTELSLDVKFNPSARLCKLIYLPEVLMGTDDPVGYGAMEGYIRQIHDVYGSMKFGPNMRLWIDPFRNEMTYPNIAVCSDQRYLDGYAGYLMQHYSDVETLNKAWEFADKGVSSFAQAARLVPIDLSDSTQIWFDIETSAIFNAAALRDAALKDLKNYRGKIALENINKMSDELKKIANVPVILKHNLWISDWFVNNKKSGGMDGTGMEAYCYGDSLAYHNTLVTYAESLASARSQWVFTTESSAAAFEGQKPYVGYVDRLQMMNDIDMLTKFGSKGFYHFGLDFAGNSMFNTTDLFRDVRQLEWLGTHSKIYQAAAENLMKYQPEVYGWYPGNLRHREIIGKSPRDYEMNGHYTGVKTQIRQCPDGRWMLPALRTSADWYGLLVAKPLLSPLQEKSLNDLPADEKVYRLGGKSKYSLNSFTYEGIGVIPSAPKDMTLGEFREKILGYRVFQTKNINGMTLPDNKLLIWTCIESKRAHVILPAGVKAIGLDGKAKELTVSDNGSCTLTLTRPPYIKRTSDLPSYLRQGYYYPDMGQPEVAIIENATVEDVLKLNAPVFHRWLPQGVKPEMVKLWQEAECFSSTTFTQPRIEGYSQYSCGEAIGINTHYPAPVGKRYETIYNIITPKINNAKFRLRKMLSPSMGLVIYLDGKQVAEISANAKHTDLMPLNPWNAGIGQDNLVVGWACVNMGDVAAGNHELTISVIDANRKSGEVDTKLMGEAAAESVGAKKEEALRCLQLDCFAITED